MNTNMRNESMYGLSDPKEKHKAISMLNSILWDKNIMKDNKTIIENIII